LAQAVDYYLEFGLKTKKFRLRDGIFTKSWQKRALRK